jgi:hypothetical protein
MWEVSEITANRPVGQLPGGGELTARACDAMHDPDRKCPGFGRI